MESPQPPKGEHAEDPEVENLAARAILQEGVQLKVRAPRFLRWLGKKTVALRIRPAYAGTMYRVSKYYLSTGIRSHQLDDLTVEQAVALMSVHGKTISRAVACAYLNGYWRGKLFTRFMGWYLRWHCKPRELFAVTTALLIYGGTQDFLNTTRSVRDMKMTAPNLGQKTKGS